MPAYFETEVESTVATGNLDDFLASLPLNEQGRTTLSQRASASLSQRRLAETFTTNARTVP